jgi:hypothetical protein
VRLHLLPLAFPLLGCSCGQEPTSNDVQRDRQERLVTEAVSQVGTPSIKNFREMKLAKDLYELRDQTGLTTYTYLWSDMAGKLTFFCTSIGYPIPYSTQFSSPETVQRWYVPGTGNGASWGTERLPQAEPNGLFTPGAAEGTWVMCKDPNGPDVKPVYVEPRIVVSSFKLLP